MRPLEVLTHPPSYPTPKPPGSVRELGAIKVALPPPPAARPPPRHEPGGVVRFPIPRLGERSSTPGGAAPVKPAASCRTRADWFHGYHLDARARTLHRFLHAHHPAPDRALRHGAKQLTDRMSAVSKPSSLAAPPIALSSQTKAWVQANVEMQTNAVKPQHRTQSIFTLYYACAHRHASGKKN